jgi:hypothetical protein
MDTNAVLSGMLLVLLATAFHPSVAYPNGAPPSVCQSMQPQHDNFTSKSSSAPFTVSVDSSNNCYTPGKPLNGTFCIKCYNNRCNVNVCCKVLSHKTFYNVTFLMLYCCKWKIKDRKLS